MDKGFWIQNMGSVIAVAVMVLAAWLARVARPVPALDHGQACQLMAQEFPSLLPENIWIAADGRGAIGRIRDQALLVWRLGDGWVARQLPWNALDVALRLPNEVSIALDGITSPPVRLAWASDRSWPPVSDGIAA